MKNKKQLYLLAGIGILLLVFFLFPDPSSADRKRTVTRAAVALEELASVMIVHEGEMFALYEQAGEWKLGERLFDVEGSKVKKLIDLAMAEWELELVSDEGAYHKYGLDEETRTELNLKNSAGETLRHFYVGENGNRYNSRYITFADDERIFLTFDKFGTTFDVEAESLRNKDMLRLNVEDIKEVRIQRQKQKGAGLVTHTLRRELIAAETPASSEESEAVPPPADGDYKWVDADGKTYKREAFNDVLNTLAALRASSFVDTQSLKETSETAQVIYEIITSEGGQSEAIVYLFKKNEDEGYLAGTSGQDFLFYIPFDDGDRLDLKIRDLVEG